MKRRYLIGGLIVVLAVVASTTIIRCSPPVLTSFSYARHVRPRVFVSHHPLRARPGTTIIISLAPDLRAEDGEITRAVAGLRRLEGGVREERTCDAESDGTFTCMFPLPAGDSDFFYDGHLELASGARVSARTPYRFTAAATLPANSVIKLREPVNNILGLQATYRVDTAWIRDPSRSASDSADRYTEVQFSQDVETAVYAGILKDPVYRWRDDQLGFYLYTDPGFTSSYYSGFDTRCGQNPWPAEVEFRNALNEMETIGILHRYADAEAVEGTIPSTPPPTATTFRDCAGDAIKRNGLGTFSVKAGIDETAAIAKHEFGHAAFGLGDEYYESDATRRVVAAPTSPTDLSCCCATEEGVDGIDTDPGSVTPGVTTRGFNSSSLQCVQAGGGIGQRFGGAGQEIPTCTNPPTFPPGCGARPQGGCGQLRSNCVRPEMWLSPSPTPSPTASPTPSPTPDDRRPNLFPSEIECQRGRIRAGRHPGVEDRSRSLGDCRELCGPRTRACPCGQEEAWIVDTNPAVATTQLISVPIPDSMGAVTAERKGGTCAWCVETSLCVRWQRARGDTVEATWDYCQAPPENAVALERASVTLAWKIIECIGELTKRWKT